jgi:hypothetical protein
MAQATSLYREQSLPLVSTLPEGHVGDHPLSVGANHAVLSQPDCTPWSGLPDELCNRIYVLLPQGSGESYHYVSHGWQETAWHYRCGLFDRYKSQPEQSINSCVDQGDWVMVARLLPYAPECAVTGSTINRVIFRTLQRNFQDTHEGHPWREPTLEWSLITGQEEVAAYYLDYYVGHSLCFSARLAAEMGRWRIVYRILQMVREDRARSNCLSDIIVGVMGRRDNRRLLMLLEEIQPQLEHGIHNRVLQCLVQSAARYDLSDLVEKYWPRVYSCDQSKMLKWAVDSNIGLPILRWMVEHSESGEVAYALEKLLDEVEFGKVTFDRDETGWVRELQIMVDLLPIDMVRERHESWLRVAENSPVLAGALCTSITARLTSLRAE